MPRRSLAAVSSFVTLTALMATRPVLADEPAPPPPPPVVPAEPVAPPPAAAPALPEGVTPIQDARPVTFVLTGGNRVVARRVGEDAEFFWVEADGRMARIRKADIASVDFQASAATRAPPPTVPQRPLGDTEWARVPQEAPAPRGRGMVIWGSILFGLGYAAAIAGSLSEDTADDGTAMLLLLPIAGPFLYAATGAERSEAGPWVIDGLLQVGGVVLFYFGITRMRESPRRQERSRAPSLDVSFGPHGGFARATWTL